jgi:hypothetical protein
MSKYAPLFKRLILHIGSHKTGTSVVQRAAHEHRDALLDQGVLYPKTGQWHDKSHHKWAFAFWKNEGGPDTLKELMADLKAELDSLPSDPDTLFLSSEILEKVPLDLKLRPTLVDVLSQLAEEIECVYFVRRQDLLLESVFKQWVKDNGSRLAKPLNGFINSQKSKMDYLEVATCWESLPKVTNMIVRTNALSKEPRAAFFDAAGLDVPPVTKEADRIINPTLDGVKLELKYFLNRLPMEPDEDQRLLSVLNSIETEKELLALVSEERRQNLIQGFASGNDKLVERYSAEPFDLTLPKRDRMIAPLTGKVLHSLLDKIYDQDRRISWLLFNKIRKEIEGR